MPAGPLPPDRFEKLYEYAVAQLLPQLDESHRGLNPANETWLAAQLKRLLAGLNAQLTDDDWTRLLELVTDEVIGYGPIGPYLRDPAITEVMVNGPQLIYIERKGKLVEAEASYRDTAHVMRAVDNIILPLGRKVDRTQPLVDARLPDGSRVNVIVPPCALNGPTIRSAITTQAQALDSADNLAQLVGEIATLGGKTDACARAGE